MDDMNHMLELCRLLHFCGAAAAAVGGVLTVFLYIHLGMREIFTLRKDRMKKGKTWIPFFALLIACGTAPADLYAEENAELPIDTDGEETTYNVIFQGNGSDSGQMDSLALAYDRTQALPRCLYAREGGRYSFCGWNTRADGTGKWFSDTQDVCGLSAEDGGEVLLYAQWCDSAPPSVLYVKSIVSDGGGRVCENPEYASRSVEYTFRLTDGDGGSGVDPDSLRISVSDSYSDGLTGDETWEKPANLKYNPATSEAVFRISGPRKGVLRVRVSDRSGKPEFEECLSGASDVSWNYSGNTGYSVERVLVIEDVKPVLEAASVKDSPSQTHSVRYSVSDGAISSGIREIRWKLLKDGKEVSEGEVYSSEEEGGAEDILAMKEDRTEGIYEIPPEQTESVNGYCELYLEAVDRSGNAGRSSPVILVYDHMPPEVSVTMDKPEHPYFFRAGNCGISVTFRDELSALQTARVSLRAGERTLEGIPDSDGTVRLSAEEVSSLPGEGFSGTAEIILEADASDAAGNRTGTMTVVNMDYSGGMEAGFILDCECPVLQSVSCDGSAKGEGEGNIPYEGFYYYNEKTVKLECRAEETYPGDLMLSYNSGGVQRTVRVEKQNDITALLEKEGVYEDFLISGRDLAGNPLTVSAECEAGGKAGCEVGIPGKRGVSLLYGKIIDRTSPSAEIRYESDACAYLYRDGHKAAEASAYYRENVKITLTVRDTYGGEDGIECGLDAARIYFGREESPSTAVVRNGKKSITIQTFARDDGVYTYTAFGTDRAGNPLRVTEKVQGRAVDMSDGRISKNYKTPRALNSYKPRFRIILDTVPPEFTFTFPDCDRKKGETYCGTTSYYRSGRTALYSVTESNFDSRRIGTKAICAGDSSSYEHEVLVWSEPTGGTGYSEGGKYLQTMDRDGVYSFAISGEDKAGNKLRQSKTESKKKGRFRTVKNAAGSFWSTYKVLDTGKPSAVISVGDFYAVDLTPEGNVFHEGNRLFDAGDTALIRIAATDASPVNIVYEIESKAEAGCYTYGSRSYSGSRSVSHRIDGEQTFCLKNVIVTDRAGNSAVWKHSPMLCLDATPPVCAISAPQPVIRRSLPSRGAGSGAADLFSTSVTLRLEAEDPNRERGCSGIRDIACEVLVDGKRVMTLKPDPAEGTGRAADDTTAEPAVWTYDLVIPASSQYESDDIEVLLYSGDMAGNQSSETENCIYCFGIDTAGPEIHVTYKNDPPGRGRYFRGPRTAEVTVSDRHPDPDHIRIITEGVVSRGAVQEELTGAEGEKTYSTRISYMEDGEFSLRVEGEDELGNPARISYEGDFPQEFVIDSGKPVIRILFDPHEDGAGGYFRSSRRALIEVREENFDGNVHVRMEARRRQGPGPSVPGIGGFVSAGDVHRAVILFEEDGEYGFSVSYTDPAGNRAESAEASRFMIDRTPPRLTLRSASLERKALRGRVVPRFFVEDENYDPAGIAYHLKTQLPKGYRLFHMSVPRSELGGFLILTGFRDTEEADNIYRLTVEARDRAGNRTVRSVMFAVNRSGSRYFSPDKGQSSEEGMLCTNDPADYTILEQNLNRVTDREVILFRNDISRRLAEGEDYKVSAARTRTGRLYRYTIDRKAFEAEGRYSIVVQSTDEAGNRCVSSAGTGNSGMNRFEFTVDKTAPVCSLEGVDLSEKAYNLSALPLRVCFTDNSGVTKVEFEYGTMTVFGHRNPEEYKVYEGRSLSELESVPGKRVLELVIRDRPEKQYVRASAYDAAGNKASECRWEAYVSTDALVRLRTKRPVILSLAAGAAAVIACIILFMYILSRRERMR